MEPGIGSPDEKYHVWSKMSLEISHWNLQAPKLQDMNATNSKLQIGQGYFSTATIDPAGGAAQAFTEENDRPATILSLIQSALKGEMTKHQVTYLGWNGALEYS